MTTDLVPAGWYPDPDDNGTSQRYWDGDTWTNQSRPRERPRPSAQSQPSGAVAVSAASSPAPYEQRQTSLAQHGQHGTSLAGKVRSPFGVWGLSLITVGIYWLVWFYKINRELRDFDSRIQVDPGLSLLAQFLPVANLVSDIKTGGRIRAAQQLAGMNGTCSGGLFFLINIFSFGICYYQSQLNQVWAHYGNQPEGSRLER